MMAMVLHACACASLIVLTDALSDNQHSGQLEVGASGQFFDMRSPLMRRDAAETNASVTKSIEPARNNSAVVENLTALRPMTDSNLTTSVPEPLTAKQLQDLKSSTGRVTAKKLQEIGTNNSAALVNSFKAELANAKARATKDEKMLVDAVSKLSSGRPLANFIAGMDTGEIPTNGLTKEQLENMTVDAAHAQFALRSTVNILSNTLSTLSSGKAMADAIFGSDTSDLYRPPESSEAASTTLPKDAFEAMDTNDDGSIQRKEWDKAKHLSEAVESQYQSQISSQQTSVMCSSDDLRQVFAAMSQRCQATAGQKFISEMYGTSETKVQELCPCILEALPHLGQDFLRRDCMPTGTTPLSHLCPSAMTNAPKVKQDGLTPVRSPPKLPAKTDPLKSAKPPAQAPLQPSKVGEDPQNGMNPAAAVLPDCKYADLRSMFDAMDDKCQAVVGKQFLTTPLMPAPDQKNLCECVDPALQKLGVRDCVPPGAAGQNTGPSFRTICDSLSDDDVENHADNPNKDQDETGLSSLGEQLMKALPLSSFGEQWHA